MEHPIRGPYGQELRDNELVHRLLKNTELRHIKATMQRLRLREIDTLHILDTLRERIIDLEKIVKEQQEIISQLKAERKAKSVYSSQPKDFPE